MDTSLSSTQILRGEQATVVRLSDSTKAFLGAGGVTLVQGHGALVLSPREAKKLGEALSG